MALDLGKKCVFPQCLQTLTGWNFFRDGVSCLPAALSFSVSFCLQYHNSCADQRLIQLFQVFFPLKFIFLPPKFLAGPLTSKFRAHLAAEDKLLVLIPEMFCSTVGHRIALLLRMGIGQCYLRSHLR